MRNVVIGSFVGFLLAAAFLAACGGAGSGGVSRATVEELELRIVQLEGNQAAHLADADAHHAPSSETPWLGLHWCIALEGVYPSRTLQLPGDGGTELAYEPQLGSIALFAGDFAPRGWAFCEGQLVNITSYSALYSLIGTTYGGDAVTTFALPDLRGRAPVGVGTGAGLTPVAWGQEGP